MASGHARGLCIAAGNSFLPLIKTIIYLVLSSEACFQTCYILKEPHIFQGNKDLVLCNETLLSRREDKKLRTVPCALTLPFNAKSFLGLGWGWVCPRVCPEDKGPTLPTFPPGLLSLYLWREVPCCSSSLVVEEE